MKASHSLHTLGSLVLTLTSLAVSCGPAQLNSVDADSTNQKMTIQSSHVGFPSGDAVDDSLGLTIAGAHCRIDVPVCANGKVKKGLHIETVGTAYNGFRPLLQLGYHYQGESCTGRANQVARYCGNTTGQVIRASYIEKNGAVGGDRNS